MLYYGNVQNIQEQCFVLNFTSFNQYYKFWPLIPPNNILSISRDEYNFDVAYMNYIMGNDIMFMEFFQVIILLHRGIDVYVIISDEDWSQMLMESLLKIIQQRYGYNATRVNGIDDVLYSDPGEFNTEYGIINYDNDLERFDYLVATINN